MAIWEIVDTEIRRRGVPIATAVKVGDKWAWRWAGQFSLERVGFTTKDETLPDVKYFYRYNPPTLQLKFKSGRTVTYR